MDSEKNDEVPIAIGSEVTSDDIRRLVDAGFIDKKTIIGKTQLKNR